MNQTTNNHDRPISNHSHGLFNNIYMRKEKNVPYSLLVSHEFSQGSYYPVPNEKLGWGGMLISTNLENQLPLFFTLFEVVNKHFLFNPV